MPRTRGEFEEDWGNANAAFLSEFLILSLGVWEVPDLFRLFCD